MKIEQFKIWLDGFGEAAGLTVDQIRCIYAKVASIDTIPQQFEFDISKSYLSPEEIKLIKNYPKVNLSEFEKSQHLQCLHSPDTVCVNCGTVATIYSSGAASANRHNPFIKCPHGSGCNICYHVP